MPNVKIHPARCEAHGQDGRGHQAQRYVQCETGAHQEKWERGTHGEEECQGSRPPSTIGGGDEHREEKSGTEKTPTLTLVSISVNPVAPKAKPRQLERWERLRCAARTEITRRIDCGCIGLAVGTEARTNSEPHVAAPTGIHAGGAVYGPAVGKRARQRGAPRGARDKHNPAREETCKFRRGNVAEICHSKPAESHA